MTEVNVTIDGVVLYCNESVANIELGKGYCIKKMYLDDIPYKSKITDGNGKLSIDYMGSRLSDDNGYYFMCIHKDDIYKIQSPRLEPGITMSAQDLMCPEQLEEYKDKEVKYLNRKFNLLRLYKEGNIGCKEIFFEHRFTLMNFISHTQNQTSINVTRNIVDSTFYSLNSDEVVKCNYFLLEYGGVEYDLMNNCIDEFIWGLEQVDIPTGFEQFTTTLEMILLGINQRNKTEVLSRRVAVLLETEQTKISTLYSQMKNYYRFRSESLHEGEGRNISVTELAELQRIVRRVLLKYLDFCKFAISNNSLITWEEIKQNKINDLKRAVEAAKNAGTLPT